MEVFRSGGPFLRGRFGAAAAAGVLVMGFLAGGTCRSSHIRFPLLSWTEYLLRRKAGPYVLSLKTPSGALLYYGSTHTFDPQDPQVADIQETWREVRPDLVLCEGTPLPVAETVDRAVESFGEHGLVRWLADRDKVPVRVFDPPVEDQIGFLLRSYPPEEVKIYYVMLMAVLLREQRDRTIEDEQIQSILDFCGSAGCAGPPITALEAELRLRHVAGGAGWRTISGSVFFNGTGEPFISRIHRDVTGYRDQVMLREIVKEMKRGGTIFALAGKAHVARQEPALRAAAMYKKPDRPLG